MIVNFSFICEAFKHEVETPSDLGNLIISNCILGNKSVFRKILHLHVKSINSASKIYYMFSFKIAAYYWINFVIHWYL